MPDIREVPRVWHPRDTGEQKRAPGLAPGVTGVRAYLAQESYSAQSPRAARDLLGERGVVVQDALRVAGDFGELGVQLPRKRPSSDYAAARTVQTSVQGSQQRPQHGPQPLDLAQEFGDAVQRDLGAVHPNRVQPETLGVLLRLFVVTERPPPAV